MYSQLANISIISFCGYLHCIVKYRNISLSLTVDICSASLFTTYTNTYSCVPVKRAGPIKPAGWNFQSNSKNEQALLSKQGGIFIQISKTSRLY